MDAGLLRTELLALLDGGQAHRPFVSTLSGVPAALQGVVPPGLTRSLWQIVEHVRLCQRDILDYMERADYVAPPFPDGVWPSHPEPPSPEAWAQSLADFSADLEALKRLAGDPGVDLSARVPGGAHTRLREVLLVADHNAYHAGQIVLARELLGIPTEGAV